MALRQRRQARRCSCDTGSLTLGSCRLQGSEQTGQTTPVQTQTQHFRFRGCGAPVELLEKAEGMQ